MLENKFITEADIQDAKRTPLKIVHTSVAGSEAPYFVDMVKDHLLDKYSENELTSENFRVYTTLDPALQRAAAAAIETGMKNVDTLLAKKYAKWKKEQEKKGTNEPIPQVQGALVALDPRTGEIKAVIGGRDYGQSQLNHALAHRQPGSVFKPFVYAAAFDNAIDNVQPIVTPATTVDDEPTTFEFDGKEYTPNNFGQKFMGRVTAREALTNSLNVATVKIAELIGYGRVVQMRPSDGSRQQHSANPSRRSWRIRNDGGRCCRRLHSFRQRRHARRAPVHQQCHRRQRRNPREKHAPIEGRPRSPRHLPRHQPAQGCDESRHRRRRPRTRLHPARSRQN
jgi:penicillin-binding protein 1B